MASFRLFRNGESRRRFVEGQQSLFDRLRVFLAWPVVVGFAFWAVSHLIITSGKDQLPYSLNQTVTNPVLSRVTFERVNQVRTVEKRRIAQEEVPNYYRINRGLLDGIQADLLDLHAAVKAAENYQKYRETKGIKQPVDETTFAALYTLTDDSGSAAFKKDAEALLKRLAKWVMVERSEVKREIRSTAENVQIDRGDGLFSPVAKEQLTYAINADHVEDMAQDAVRDLFLPAVRPALAGILKQAVVPDAQHVKPIYVFDEEYTRTKIAEAGALAPLKDSYRAGDRLVAPGPIDGEALALLKAEHEEFLRQRHIDPFLVAQWRKEKVGTLGLTFLITAGLAVFGVRCLPRAVVRTPRAIALAALLLLMLFLDRYVLVAISASPVWSVMTITMTAAILTLTYSQLFALGVTLALSLLTVLAYEAAFSTLIIYLTVAAVTILMFREIRTRLQILEVGGIAAIAGFVSTFLVALTQQQNLGYVFKESAFAALAGLTGVSIVLVILPVIERMFRVTTNLTLLEWADTSKPLLRELIETAPGTWQHSHLLGSMAESAAEEIGANGLLVRVGAYYHDIGKMSKPNYFVENQSAAKASAHRGLAPTMSTLVILAHVKDGLALAKEHGLPRVLWQFILEHHGTTVVKYFHAMAQAKAGGKTDQEVSESSFRYPGPKPRSHETAILMIADGVEGAVRTLQDPTPSRIEAVVHEIVMARLLDGQFDDCDITLKELARVEQSLVRSLCAIHHGRIAYPKISTESDSHVRTA